MPAEVYRRRVGRAGTPVIAAQPICSTDALIVIGFRAEYGLGGTGGGAGAADPSSIDFSWHQRNFEDAVAALRDGRQPSVSGAEARRAVALIEAIYKSSAAGGEKVEVG